MLKILKAGVLSSIQDLGRFGFRHIGVSQSGVLDPMAMQLSNLLLGNPLSTPVIEITMGMAEFEFTKAVPFSLTGGDLNASLNGKPLSPNFRYNASAGDRLIFKGSAHDQRCYISVLGGFDALLNVMGSYSTDLQAGFGGANGQKLNHGDALNYTQHPALSSTGAVLPLCDSHIRFIPNEALNLSLNSDDTASTLLLQFLNAKWTISATSNRMGARLHTSEFTELSHQHHLPSQAVSPGIIQLPPSGEPIVLLNDCQTTGGYPILGHVIEADLRHFSQFGAGKCIQFSAVDGQTADLANQENNRLMARFSSLIHTN